MSPLGLDIQKIIERSVFERIRLQLVALGYTPDINLPKFTKDAAGSQAWQAELKAIAFNLGFAVEVFGHSSYRNKELKRVPRIVILPRRMMPGDIGTMGTFGYQKLPNNPNVMAKTSVDYNSSHFFFDVSLVSETAEQDRFLNYVLHRALGVRNFINRIDTTDELFFLEQYNYYDLPDTPDNIEEKVYSYKISDVWLYEEFDLTNSALINCITIETKLLGYESDTEYDTIGDCEVPQATKESNNLLSKYISTEVGDVITSENNNLFQTE